MSVRHTLVFCIKTADTQSCKQRCTTTWELQFYYPKSPRNSNGVTPNIRGVRKICIFQQITHYLSETMYFSVVHMNIFSSSNNKLMLFTFFRKTSTSLATYSSVPRLYNSSGNADRDRVIWKVLYPAMNDASLVSDCLPEPPTPTSSAWPFGVRMMREILMRFVIASCSARSQLRLCVCNFGGDGRHQEAAAWNKKESPLFTGRRRWPYRERREPLRSLCKTSGTRSKRKFMRK